MDQNSRNINRNSSESKGTNDMPREEFLKHKMGELNDLTKDMLKSAKEGAIIAAKTPIDLDDIKSFRRSLEMAPDEVIGKDADDFMNMIVDFLEKYPNELVLVKLLWVISSLASSHTLEGFAKSLAVLSSVKEFRDSLKED